AAAVHLAGLHGRHEVRYLETIHFSPAISVHSKHITGDVRQCIATSVQKALNGGDTYPCGGNGRISGNDYLRNWHIHSDITSEVTLPPKANELDMAIVQSDGRFP